MEILDLACNICGSVVTDLHLEKKGHRIVRCSRCGLVFVNPRSVTDADKLYSQDYFDYYILTEKVDKQTYDRRLKLVERFVEKNDILDVGSSTGGFLEVAQKRGWTPHGLDIVDHYRKEIHDKLGIDIQIGEFMDVPLDDNRFSAVNMGDSIEHMADPRAALEKVFRVLKPGGVLFLRTPDVESISNRLFRAKWIHYKPVEHLYYFSRTTLRLLLERIGFDILQIGYSGTYCSIEILQNRLAHYYNGSLAARLFTILADRIRLSDLSFYFNAFDEVQILARKPGKYTAGM